MESDGKVETKLNPPVEAAGSSSEIGITPDTVAMLDFLSDLGRRVGLASRLGRLVQNITQMTRHALSASAASVFFFNDREQELFFEVANGSAGKTLKHMTLSAGSGFAGWVARHGKSLIVNDTMTDPRFNKEVDRITGFVTRSAICAPMIIRSKVIGVIEVLNKIGGQAFTQSDLETLTSVAATAAIAIENDRLHDSILKSYKGTIKALAAAIDAKDHYTRGHSQRVMEYALLGGSNLGLSKDELESLEYAGMLHDIGKIGIADTILSKPQRLDDNEWKIMRQHPRIGANIVKQIPFLQMVKTLVLHHHERYDGTGYPQRLKGEMIPVGARLLAVADAFDTMTTDRSYRPALGLERAIHELRTCSGTQFCPMAAQAFLSGHAAKLK